MSTRIGETEQRLSARITKTETALLTEFHKWASPAEVASELALLYSA
jgi:hypothetical protein